MTDVESFAVLEPLRRWLTATMCKSQPYEGVHRRRCCWIDKAQLLGLNGHRR